MNDAVNTAELNELKAKVRHVSDFLTLFEEATEKLKQHELSTQKRLEQSEDYFNERLQSISQVLEEVRELSSQAGTARLRATADHILEDGKKQLESIQEASRQFQKLANENCQRLEHSAECAAGWIADAVKSLEIENFRHLIFDNLETVEVASNRAVKRINKMVKWFHWEKLGIALIVAVLVSFMTGLFINDELPWATHHDVVVERDAGRMLLRAWPKLTMNDRQDIETASAASSAEYV